MVSIGRSASLIPILKLQARIHQNVVSIDIGESIEDFVISDTRLLEECVKDEKKRNRTIIEIEKMLKLRLGNPKYTGTGEFKKLSEKLRELQDKLRQKLIDSIQFLKDLLALAKETLETEKKLDQPEDKRKKAKDALTELFESVKTPGSGGPAPQPKPKNIHIIVDPVGPTDNVWRAAEPIE